MTQQFGVTWDDIFNADKNSRLRENVTVDHVIAKFELDKETVTYSHVN